MTTVAFSILVCNLSALYDPEFLRVAKAIMWEESRGDAQAVGDGGCAIGPYQIHRAYWQDGTRLLGVDCPYTQARDPGKALAVVYAYTRHYAQHYGRPWTAETIARIHNGGPRGWEKKATLSYWKRVRSHLDPMPVMAAAHSVPAKNSTGPGIAYGLAAGVFAGMLAMVHRSGRK